MLKWLSSVGPSTALACSLLVVVQLAQSALPHQGPLLQLRIRRPDPLLSDHLLSFSAGHSSLHTL